MDASNVGRGFRERPTAIVIRWALCPADDLLAADVHSKSMSDETVQMYEIVCDIVSTSDGRLIGVNGTAGGECFLQRNCQICEPGQ